MLSILTAVLVALACGFCVGTILARRRSRRKTELPLKIILRMPPGEDPLVEFLVRERRFLRHLGYRGLP